MDCLFCKIIDRKIPSTIIYEDEHVIAIDDITPRAPQHKLILPKKHIATLNDLSEKDAFIMGHMTQAAKKIASTLGIADDGYRVIINCNAGAGQTVFHLHMHLMGGRIMTWPPG
jgi:histidine triad (HIT) family protein